MVVPVGGVVGRHVGQHQLGAGGLDGPPQLVWHPNPDILKGLGAHANRPTLLVGFAAETGDAEGEADAKRARKGADWVVGNDVVADPMGGADNKVVLATAAGVEHWERMSKTQVARRLADRIAQELKPTT